MSAVPRDLLAVIDNLPRGSNAIIPDVPWEAYESLVESLQDRSEIRLAYDNGRLQIVNLSEKQEQISALLPHLIDALSTGFSLQIRSQQCCTLKKPSLRMGIQPDECYYLGVSKITGDKTAFDLDQVPPPDLAIRIDPDFPTLDKLPIYASLGVRELWQLANNRIQFYLLENGSYFIMEHSDLFHLLTADELAEYLSVGQIEGQASMIKLIQTRTGKK